jgi:16S rRNA (adenine1518-N6/adenine1519-N6)-dimethyltransferase
MYTLKKSLGQHFLKDENICRKIVAVLEQRPFSQLLEVGPGGGALTKYLLQINNIDFKAVELDSESGLPAENISALKGRSFTEFLRWKTI